jgi:predicted nucleotidyltransferase
MKQQEVLQKIITELRADSSITAVMLMGSAASGTQTETSDLDLFILGNRNKYHTEIVDDILVEYLYYKFDTAQSKLDKHDMEVYHYLGSKILYDLDGKLMKLIRTALNKYHNYKTSEKEIADLKHSLSSYNFELNAAIKDNNILKADFITATMSWKAVETVFAANSIPLPPTSRMLQELPNLKITPEQDWFIKLFGKDTKLRTQTMLNIINWALSML